MTSSMGGRGGYGKLECGGNVHRSRGGGRSPSAVRGDTRLRPPGLSLAQVRSRLKRGLGRVKDGEYRSFIPRRAARTRGERTEESAFGSERQLSLMSRGERRVALMLWWDEEVLDVREGYPLLPVDETVEIAEELQVRFPMGRNRQPLVRTFDFLVRHARLGVVAFSRKDRNDLDAPRLLQLLEIERRFAQRRGWHWAALTEDDVPETMAANLQILNEHWLLSGVHANASKVTADATWLMSRLQRRGRGLLDTCRDFDASFDHEPGTGLSIAWHQLAHKCWNANLDEPLDARVTRPHLGPPILNRWIANRSFL